MSGDSLMITPESFPWRLSSVRSSANSSSFDSLW